MNSNIIEIEARAGDVSVASVILHKASKKVVKLREEMALMPLTTCPYVLTRLQDEIETAETVELQAEKDWELAIARLEFAEAEAE